MSNFKLNKYTSENAPTRDDFCTCDLVIDLVFVILSP